MESSKRCLSLLLPILEKLSKFSQNYKFREVFSKRGTSFSGGVQNFKLAGAKSLQGVSRFRVAPSCRRKLELTLNLSVHWSYTPVTIQYCRSSLPNAKT